MLASLRWFMANFMYLLVWMMQNSVPLSLGERTFYFSLIPFKVLFSVDRSWNLFVMVSVSWVLLVVIDSSERVSQFVCVFGLDMWMVCGWVSLNMKIAFTTPPNRRFISCWGSLWGQWLDHFCFGGFVDRWCRVLSWCGQHQCSSEDALNPYKIFRCVVYWSYYMPDGSRLSQLCKVLVSLTGVVLLVESWWPSMELSYFSIRPGVSF